MQRFILVVCLTAFATIAPVVAQPTEEVVHSTKGVEIGTLFGLSRFPADDTTIIGVPTFTLFSSLWIPSLYVSWFPNERLALGPEFSFGMRSEEGDSITTLSLGSRGAFFLQSNAASGPYLLGNGTLAGLYTDGASRHLFSAGAGLGYQSRIGPAFFLRAEGRYRRWAERRYRQWIGENEFSLFIGLGTRLNGK